nr:hypothetical protein [Micromonospora sp. DSM 115978]
MGASLVAGLIGTVVLIGWAAELEVLARIVSGLPLMVPWTAVGLLTAAFALVLVADRAARRRLPRASTGAGAAATAAGAAVAALGVTVLVEYLAAVPQGIDLALFGNTVSSAFGPDAEWPGRPSPQTATAFTCLGVAAVSLVHVPDRRRWLVAAETAVVVVAATIALTALLGHVYNVTALAGVSL